jgi:hypothetical protein
MKHNLYALSAGFRISVRGSASDFHWHDYAKLFKKNDDLFDSVAFTQLFLKKIIFNFPIGRFPLLCRDTI